MNLVDPDALGPADGLRPRRRATAGAAVAIARAELVGLVPAAVLDAIEPGRWAELDLRRSARSRRACAARRRLSG